MKKIISLILSVTMLASAAQLYASADIAPEVVQTEAVRETTAQSTAQETTETVQSADSESNTDIAESGSASAYTSAESSLSTESAKIKTAANALLKSETADEEQSGKLTTVNSPMLKLTLEELGKPVDLGESFYAKITNVGSGTDVALEHYDASTLNDNVVIYGNSNYSDNIWKFTRKYSEKDGYFYTIQNMYNKKYLRVEGDSADESANIIVTNNYDEANLGQNWFIYKYNGNYCLKGACTYFFMDVSNNSTSDNADIRTYTLHGGTNQQFKIVKYAPARTDDIPTVTSDAINFQLFNYNKNINRAGGAKGTDENGNETDNWRPLAPYFSFRDTVSANDTPYADFDKLWAAMEKYDATDFGVNHATVEPTLLNNYPVIRLDNKQPVNGEAVVDPNLPQNERSLAYLFGGEEGNQAVEAYSPTNTLLQQNGTHYYYNSTDIAGASEYNAADYDQASNSFRVRNYAERSNGTFDYLAFYPFNTTYDYDNTETIHYIPEAEIDYWFGMRMDVNFIQSQGGMLNDEQMIFSFSGDDDVWVFIDDVLVLDLGGTHGAVTGTINFATGDINSTNGSTARYSTNLYTRFADAENSTPNGGWKTINEGTEDETKIFADYTSHKLSFFILERGAGSSTCCMDFNLPTIPKGSVAVSKDVYTSDDNIANSKDDTEYEFKISHNGTALSDDEAVASKSDDSELLLTKSTDGTYTSFKLKGGEIAVFKRLSADKTYKIEEVIDGRYITKTEVNINGETPSTTTYAEVQPDPNNPKTVNFKNTIKSVDINFKFYNRDPSTGKTADISNEVNTYSKTYIGKEYGDLFVTSPDTDKKQTQFSNMITNAGTVFSDNYKNVLDEYVLFTSQASAESTITSFPNYHKNADGSVKYETQKYHTDCHGYTQTDSKYSATKDEKWVTYKDNNNQEIIVKSGENELTNEASAMMNTDSVAIIDVWLFNNPRQYDVSVYGATESGHLNQIGDKYVANEINHSEYKAFYNQRLGSAIDNGGYIDSATDYLEAYGISGYIGQSVSTASAIGNLKFSYWSFDKDGKTVASTDRRYNFRIKNNLTLYAVYETTPLSAKKDDSGNIVKGLSVSMNDPDIYVKDGKERICLNTEINPYNCPDQDTNIQNIAAVYIIDKYANVVMDDGIVTQLKQIITDNLSAIKRETSGSTYKAIDISKLNSPKTITDCDGHEVALTKGNYYVYYVDAFVKPVDGVENQVILTNKNRTEFLINFAKDTLKNKRLLAFGAMLYGSDVSSASWITSDNCIDYAFDSNAEAYDPSTTISIAYNDRQFVFDSAYYKAKNADNSEIRALSSYDDLYNHFITEGIKSGLKAHPYFDVKYYLENNETLKQNYGSTNYIAAINHYVAYDLPNTINSNTAQPADFGADVYVKISSDYIGSGGCLYIKDDNYVYKQMYATDSDGELETIDELKAIWHFVKQSDGSYVISNNGKYLNLTVEQLGTKLSVSDSRGQVGDNTHWYIYLLPNGQYKIKPAVSNHCMIDVDGTRMDGSVLVYYDVFKDYTSDSTSANQQFNITLVNPYDDKYIEEVKDITTSATYQILLNGTTKYLSCNAISNPDINGDRSAETIASDSVENPNWFLMQSTEQSTEQSRAYKFRYEPYDVEGDKDFYLNIYGGVINTDVTNICVYDGSYGTAANEAWKIYRNKITGCYYIRTNKDTNYALSVNSSTNNVELVAFDASSPNQQLNFIKVSDATATTTEG